MNIEAVASKSLDTGSPNGTGRPVRATRAGAGAATGPKGRKQMSRSAPAWSRC